MNKEALELIQDTARQAAAPVLIDKLNTDGRKAFVAIDGALTSCELPPAPIAHQVYAAEELAYYAKSLGDSVRENCELWHAPQRVTLVIDKHDRRDVAIFALTFSRPFQVLQRLDKAAAPMDQRSFCRMLKFDLGLSHPMVAPFTKLDWQTMVQARGEVALGRDRLGREITSQVAGTVDLPEVVTVVCPVYDQKHEREPVRVACAVDIVAEQQRLSLQPLPGQIEEAIETAQADLRTRLTDKLDDLEIEIPIYYGMP